MHISPECPDDDNRDRLVFSKGHAASALYAVLAMRGFFPQSILDTYATPGNPLGDHPIHNSVPGLEIAAGSLGHGLPIAAGMALAAKIKSRDYRTFAILSDGECNEGSVWEAAMFAPARQLDNLVAIVDFNKWQATGRSTDVLSLQPLADKWRDFGWHACEIDGHDMSDILQSLEEVPREYGKPTVIIANTIKGKGISFMEDDNNWHYRIPTFEEVTAAHRELGLI